MKLAPLFEAVAPYFEGQTDAVRTIRTLYGESPPSEAQRLAIYERFCREHRNTATGGVHQYLRDLIEKDRGEPFWRALVEAYFVAHPMRHVEINQNGEHLAAYLASRDDLPPLWSAVADFEWWEWQTLIARDEPMDFTDDGPLRIASTVELRPYRFDLVSWFDAKERAAAPEQRDVVVLFWRKRNLDPRRANTSSEELMVLKRVSEGLAVEVDAVVQDLHGAGILVGNSEG